MVVRPLMSGLFGTTALMLVLAAHSPAHAQAGTREAQIVVDAQTNEVLYESNAQSARRPASITKVMTLYLLFDALQKGDITWDDRIVFSRNAANQPPTKLFVGAGNSIPVQTAVEALVLRSANDVATAVAERLGGSESNFAAMMTSKARELGMSSTTFRNASGLPNATQRTTAEDLARLAIAIHRDFPDQYHWFSAQQMSWNGQIITGHNHLLKRVAGMDGLKTGYTNASGFNLAATTQRSGRRIITVVLGGANRFQRDDLVEALTESAFRELGIGVTQFAANTTAYEYNFRDARDAADAAALVMDLPPRAFSMGGLSTIAMVRSGRRIGFERGAPTFQVADMTRRPEVARTIMGRGPQLAQREERETGVTDEGETETFNASEATSPRSVPFQVAVTPNARPLPVRVMTPRVPTAVPTRVPVIFPSTAQYNRTPPVSLPVFVPAPVATPLRQMVRVETPSPRSEVQVPLTSTPYALRGTLGSPVVAPAPETTERSTEAAPTQVTPVQMAENGRDNLPAPVASVSPISVAQTPEPASTEQASPALKPDTVQFAEAAPAQSASAPSIVQPSDGETAPIQSEPRTQIAELAQQDATSLASGATDTPDELNGSINLAETTAAVATTTQELPATSSPTASTSEAAPTTQTRETAPAIVQMAAVTPDAVAQAQLRQSQANAREQARIDDAQAQEATRREANRVQAAAAARVVAERLANERRAERQLAEARAKTLKEKEARDLVVAEQLAARERAVAAREESRRQTEASRARNARGSAVVQVGAFKDKKDATAAIAQFARFFPSFAQTEVSSVSRRDGIWYRARFAGLGALAANEACRLVSGRGGACQIVGD